MFGFFKRKPEPQQQPESQGPLVAIIEDEQDLVHILKFSLERAGYAVITADNGETGLELVRQRRPALIVLDIKMPRMNGYQVLAQLNQDAELSSTPVIVITSVTSEENISDEEWARKLEVARFLTKPFEPEAFVEIVKQVLAPKES